MKKSIYQVGQDAKLGCVYFALPVLDTVEISLGAQEKTVLEVWLSKKLRLPIMRREKRVSNGKMAFKLYSSS